MGETTAMIVSAIVVAVAKRAVAVRLRQALRRDVLK